MYVILKKNLQRKKNTKLEKEIKTSDLVDHLAADEIF